MPNADHASIDKRKITEFLLNDHHPRGGSRAFVLRRFGYSELNVEVLERDLLEIAHVSEVQSTREQPFGINYVVDGVLLTPSGRLLQLRTIWTIGFDEQSPRFASAFPLG